MSEYSDIDDLEVLLDDGTRRHYWRDEGLWEAEAQFADEDSWRPHDIEDWERKQFNLVDDRWVSVDLRGTDPYSLSVECRMRCDWSDERIREEAAKHYKVPLEKVGAVKSWPTQEGTDA